MQLQNSLTTFLPFLSWLSKRQIISKWWKGWFVYFTHREVIIRKHFFPCLIIFFCFSVLCKLLLHYLRPKFCTQLRFLYFFFQKEYDNVWFTGHHLISLLDLVLSLPEGAETDLLQNSDRWVAIIVGSFSPFFII